MCDTHSHITLLLRPSLPLQGPWRLMEEGYARHGDAFTVPVAHKRVTFLIGPDVAPHFFKATDDEMSQTEV
jgi:sterol 14alpha-demethylase